MRIRVSQTELEQISRDGVASDAIRFGADAALEYGIEVRGGAPLQARFTGTEVRVIVPESALGKWLSPDEVSISGEQALNSGETLKILVEKDFTCLAPREGEDDSDLFPNPALGAG